MWIKLINLRLSQWYMYWAKTALLDRGQEDTGYIDEKTVSVHLFNKRKTSDKILNTFWLSGVKLRLSSVSDKAESF